MVVNVQLVTCIRRFLKSVDNICSDLDPGPDLNLNVWHSGSVLEIILLKKLTLN